VKLIKINKNKTISTIIEKSIKNSKNNLKLNKFQISFNIKII